MEYLNDQIIDTSVFDSFGHLELAKEITHIITSHKEDEKSLTIGIFGKWGVGKSSVLNLLKNEIMPEEIGLITYFEIPIWKYNDPKSIRRKFIYQIAKKLGKEDEINNLYNEVTTEINHTILDKISNQIEKLGKDTEKLLGVSLVILGFLFMGYIFLKDIISNLLFHFFSFSLVITLIGVFIELIQVIKFSKINITKKNYESEEQFEHKFEEMLENEKGKKIFIIDDLDRCESSKILAVF